MASTMYPNILRQRWQNKKGKQLIKKIINALKSNQRLEELKDIEFIFFQGKKYADLRGISLEDETIYTQALRKIDFSFSNLTNITFTTHLHNTVFSDLAFNLAVLKGIVFRNVTIRNIYFYKTIIEDSDLSGINFEGRNYLIDSKLRTVDFSNSNFDESVFFYVSNSEFQQCPFKGFKGNESIFSLCYFSTCDLREANFSQASLMEIVLKDCIANIKTNFDTISILERAGFYDDATYAYIQIKNLFKNNGLISESRKYYYREMVSKRKGLYKKVIKQSKSFNDIKNKLHNNKILQFLTIKLKSITNWFTNLFKWLLLKFYDLTAGYGEKPQRVFLFALFWIFFSTIIYFYSGIENDTSTINYEYSTEISEGNIKDFFLCLYFSVMTFTNLLGSGWQPMNGMSKLFANLESFTGVILIAVFIVTITRKMIQD